VAGRPDAIGTERGGLAAVVKRRKTGSKRSALYVRVSSEEQVDGYSLDAQVRAIESSCEQHGYDLVARYRDEGKSARTDNLKKRLTSRVWLLTPSLVGSTLSWSTNSTASGGTCG
jgi:hypothetical protein